MDNYKVLIFNSTALALSITKINPYLQSIALSLTIIYTIIKISKKLK